MTNYQLDKHDIKRLDQLEESLRRENRTFIGFPATLDYSYPELDRFKELLINNIGPPDVSSLSKHDTKQFEWEVICFFAELFRAPADDFWGYVTNGGTEGNLYGLYIGRSLHRRAKVYYSRASHYSIPKNIRILRMTGVEVPVQQHDEIDYEAFRRILRAENKEANEAGAASAIVVANVGTTMAEAKDDVRKIRQILLEEGIEDAFVHCDGALAAPYSALLEPRWPFDFADGADSISFSGHKYIGSPVPCGVVLTRDSYHSQINSRISYIDCPDPTISGSRNGHTVLNLWCAIRKMGRDGLKKRAEEGIEIADYTLQRLQEIGWPSWRNQNTLTTMLAKPPEEILRKWQLATHNGWSHIICMPGVSRTQIDEFVSDLSTSRAPV